MQSTSETPSENPEQYIKYQLETYNRIQETGTNLLGGVLTVVAVIATLIAALYDVVLPFNPNFGNSSLVLLSFKYPGLIADITIGASYLIFWVLIFISAFSYSYGVYMLLDIATEHRLEPVRPDQNIPPVTTEYSPTDHPDEIDEVIRHNQKMIIWAHSRLLNAALRFLLVLLGTTTIYFFYTSISNSNISWLIMFNTYIFVLGAIPAVVNRFRKSNRTEYGSLNRPFETRLMEEISEDTDLMSRANTVSLNMLERITLYTIAGTSSLIIIGWIVLTVFQIF